MALSMAIKMTNSALTRINEESDNDGSSAHSSNAYEDREAQGGKYGSKIRWQDLNYPLVSLHNLG